MNTETKVPNEIQNPYTEAKTDGRLYNIQARIGDEDYRFVRRCSDGDFITRGVIGRLWKELTIALKTANITDYADRDAFIEFINSFTIRDGRFGVHGGTTSGVNTQATGPNDNGGIAAVGGASEGVTNLSPNTEGSTPGAKVRQKGRKGNRL